MANTARPTDDGGWPAECDDARLMARVQAGDREAFRELHDRFAPRLFRLLVRLCGDGRRAEDLLQEVFLRVWKAAPRYEPLAPLEAWLRRIARNTAWSERDYRRRRPHLRAASLDAFDAADEARDRNPRNTQPLEQAALAEESRRLVAAVAGLPARLRWTFVLVRLEGLSLAEAALATELPLGTIKSRLFAAERRLASVLRRLDRGAGPTRPSR